MMQSNPPMSRMFIYKGDITKLQVDAIVNAANSSLLGGGGVDGAIHKAGGPAILAECVKIRDRQGGCATGDAVITTGGNLKTRHVIHTVGPVWNGGKMGEACLLENCYLNSLRLAVANGDKTVAFPCISTGIYCYPKREAAKTAVRAVEKFLDKDDILSAVVFVCYDESDFQLYHSIINQLFNFSS